MDVKIVPIIVAELACNYSKTIKLIYSETSRINTRTAERFAQLFVE
jgi:hypothetical protein